MATWICSVCLETSAYHPEDAHTCHDCIRDLEGGKSRRDAYEHQDNEETVHEIEAVLKADKLGTLSLGGLENSFIIRIRKIMQDVSVPKPLSGRQILYLRRIHSRIRH